MRKLEQQLKDWVANGIIERNQAERIFSYETQQQKQKPEANWSISGPMILGAVIIGIGAISLIASNWDVIPDVVKLGGDFLILIALALSIMRAKEQKNQIIYETLIVLFGIFCLASIGLISQIYHTGGEFQHGILL